MSLYGSSINRQKSINPLIRAVMLDHTQHAINLVDRGHAVNVYDNEEHSPLYYAVEKNNEGFVTFLLERDIGLWEIPPSEKARCLHFAIEKGLNSIVKIFVINWVSPNCKNYLGDTALINAVKHGNKEAADILLIAGAFSEYTDSLDNTPLHIAAENGDIALVRLLVNDSSAYEILKLKNCKNKTAYDLAKRKRDQNLLHEKTKCRYQRVMEALEAKENLYMFLEMLAVDTCK